MLIDLFLIAALGFLGSFGHCVGMCGPLTVAFSLSSQSKNQSKNNNWRQQSKFHILLNLGRMLSYGLVGAAIGALGSILVEGGQLAGVGSELRQWIAIITGLMLILFGLRQINPNFLPKIPFLHPLLQGGLHNRLNAGMSKLSLQNTWYTPLVLGMTWGLMPCGFLYTAQIKAAQTGNMWMGAATMLAFGLGTFPMMLGVGVSASLVSKDKRSQLFRLGGWVTLAIGVITLLRNWRHNGRLHRTRWFNIADASLDCSSHQWFMGSTNALSSRFRSWCFRRFFSPYRSYDGTFIGVEA